MYPCHSLISGTGNTSTDGSYKPSFLTDQELKHLILEVRTAAMFSFWDKASYIINLPIK